MKRRGSKAHLKLDVKRIVYLVLFLALVVIYNEFFSGEHPDPKLPVPTPTIDVDNNGERIYTDSNLEVLFFDVGQADSILLRTDDKVMLVDTGNAGDSANDDGLKDKINLIHELKRLGIEKIDVLVATHPHEDHMGSMYKIINYFPVERLYANSLLPESEWANYYRKFVEAITKKDVHLITPTTLTDEEIMAKVDEYNRGLKSTDEKVTFNPDDYIRVGDTIPFGNATVTMLAPNSSKYSDTNDYSIVLMVEFEGVKVLLTGDAGKVSETEILGFAEKNRFDIHADVLKVGHHGSRTASTEDFIKAVLPYYSVIMVENGNSYGLPDEDVIERLQRCGSTIYQTMDVGDILLLIDDGRYNFDLLYQHEEKGGKK